MKKEELNKWFKLKKEFYLKGISKWDYQELVRLNHLVMEIANKIHNDNMLSK